MKLTVILVVLLGLMGCNTTYPSIWQASSACSEWESEEKKVYGNNSKVWDVAKQKEVIIRDARPIQTSRKCTWESETNQILGLVNQVIENDEWIEDENEGNFKVMKNFRY